MARQVQVEASSQVPIALRSQASWRDSSARPGGRSRTFRLRLRRLRQGSLQDDARRLLRPSPPGTDHRRARPVRLRRRREGRCATPWHGTDIKDLIVVIERTGRYHGPIQRAFRQAGFEVRILHPYTTKQYRSARRSGQQNRRHRPLRNPPRRRQRLRPVGARTRSDLRPPPATGEAPSRPRPKECHAPAADARTSSILHARIFTVFYGYFRFRHRALGGQEPGLRRRDSSKPASTAWANRLRKADIKSHQPTLEKIVAWARSAPSAEEPASLHRRFFLDLDADRLAKLQVIRAIESELAEPLSQTPYVLLLGIPRNQRRLGGRIRGRDGTDRALCQGPSDYRQSRFVPVAVPERRGRSSATVRWCDTPTTTCGVRSS